MVEEKAPDAGTATKLAIWPGIAGQPPKGARVERTVKTEEKEKEKTQIEP